MPKVPTISIKPQFKLGIDPGVSGGMALISSMGTFDEGIAFGNSTDHQIAEWLRIRLGFIHKAAIEKVNAMPRQGVVSMFTFGNSCGFLRGLLVAFQIPFVEVRPQVWQKALRIPPKGSKTTTQHKKLLQAKAHQRWPKHCEEITKAVADASLIAEWLRLQEVDQ